MLMLRRRKPILVMLTPRLCPPWGGVQAVEWVAADERVVDMALLQSRDPILYYDDLSLYEDELHDHGLVSLSVKARVMPKYDTRNTHTCSMHSVSHADRRISSCS